MKRLVLVVVVIGLLSGCKHTDETNTLFKLVDVDYHGISFKNTISENDSLNILTLEYIYNGGGVAIGDFNRDGLSDIFFTGNMVPNRLYLNRGNLKFEDVTEKAGISSSEKWRSGVAVADVNSDGYPDIYVCSTIKKDSALRANTLFINQGVDADGIPVFKDEAAAYGVNYRGHSSNAAFLDYDNDGDLDLYVLTNTIQKGIPTSYRPKINDGSTVNTDRLFRNNGNGSFTDISIEAGIIHEGYGLGLAIADINQDGWQDIYVSNDYITNDLLYINNKNGTFTNAIDERIKHQSQFSMGNDIADINNDALPDIITLDMLPEGNLRRKTVITGASYVTYINNLKYNYAHQYVRNMLQLNNGHGTFSEIGQLAGVHQTEWSWSPLIADFDNDGHRDLIITNGFPRDITDKDFGNFRNGPGGNIASIEFLLDSIPVVKIPNYAFENNGDLTFKNATKDWGMNHPSFSNGAAFADFDNDGDLDYVVNNINDAILFYENTLNSSADSESVKSHYLRIKLKGKEGNLAALGAKIFIRYTNGKLQYHDHSVYRGYLSTVEDVIHFGLGEVDVVDTVEIRWPDGNQSLLKSVKADQVLIIDHAQSRPLVETMQHAQTKTFKNNTATVGVSFIHEEEDKIDFNVQRTIPHKFSQTGPGLAVGDVNNDGLEDFYVGAPAKKNGTVFLRQTSGKFLATEIMKSPTREEEDQGALFFDADGDHDLDLYVVSGSFEYAPNAVQHQDRLYINNGSGKFRIAKDALPSTLSSGSCVRAADIDSDGDLDLFVGGRVTPWKYPLTPESYILVNHGGKFINQTEMICKELKNAGMITDAIWTDFNNDNKSDLIVTGEFMPILAFQNDGRKLSKVAGSGLENYSGWWNSIAAGDFDNDGDVDYITGNLGANNYYKASSSTPLRVYAKDIDANNSIDAVLSCYLMSEEGDLKEFPAHFWEDLNSQSPKFRRKFDYYKKFGRATIEQLLTEEERKDALTLEMNYSLSSYIENLGNGKFKIKALPTEAQVAPMNGIVTDDFNQDGKLDILAIGNDYGNEVFTGRHDAFTGLVMIGDGDGNFKPMPSAKSGFLVDRDAKALAKISGAQSDLFVATQNRDSLKIFVRNHLSEGVKFDPQVSDIAADLIYNDNSKRRVEFYFGSGYLSQSTRVIQIPADVKEVLIYNTKGETRSLSLKRNKLLSRF